MKLLFKTTSEEAALNFQREAQEQYGGIAIYRFQYRAIDGNFYYEILLNPIWID